MKILKYIFLLLTFIGFFSESLEAKSVSLENDKIESFSEQDFKETSAETEWLGLLCLHNESLNQSQLSFSQFYSGKLSQNFNGKLCLISTSENLESSFQLDGNLESHQGSCGRNGKVFHGSPDLIDAWKILDDADSPLKTNVDELRDVSKYLDNVDNFGSYNNWRLRTGRTKHPNWTQVDNVASKIQGRLSHVDYLDFKGNGFEGCHTQNAMNQFLNDNPGWTGGFIDRNGNPVSLLDNSVVEAYPWVKNTNGNIFTKLNGAQNNINGVQYGKASFFPKNWDTAKLKREVEHAISNNHGLVSGNTYKGYSTDGTIEINFYYNISTGRIISFFPKKL